MILQNCQPIIDGGLITKDKIQLLFKEQMNIINFNMDTSDPLNLARNQFAQCQEEKYQKTIEVIEKYLNN